MARKIQVKRGNQANLPNLDIGEFGFSMDQNRTFIGGSSGNVELANKSEVMSQLADIAIDPKLFGAKGDGVANDAAAIQAAVDSLSSSGGVVQLSDGTYRLNSEVLVKSNVSLAAKGKQVVVVIKSPNVNGFKVLNAENVSIKGLTIIGDYSNPTDFSEKNNGIFIKSSKNVTVRECVIKGVHGCGIEAREYKNVTIADNVIEGNLYGHGGSSDISLYSGASGSVASVTGNKCYSDNSQGISINQLGLDKDCIIKDNFIITRDANGNEKTTGMQRRHGIIVGYLGVPSVQNIMVINNVIRNTKWTGVYYNSNAPTDAFLQVNVTIAGNILSNVAQEIPSNDTTNNSLFAGIWIGRAATGAKIINNKINNSGANPGIKCHTYFGATMSENTIYNCGKGIYLYNTCFVAKVFNNEIVNTTEEDVLLSNASHANYVDIAIKRNDIRRNNINFRSIDLNHGSSNADVVIEVLDNVIRGSDKATQNDLNVAVFIRRAPFSVRGNTIKNFCYALYTSFSWTQGTVGFNDFSAYVIKDNVCDVTTFARTVAFENGFALAESNDIKASNFTELSGSKVLRAGYRLGLNVVMFDTTQPANGTWRQGDRVKNSAPSNGQPKGWICTVAGTPGTWVSEGNL